MLTFLYIKFSYPDFLYLNFYILFTDENVILDDEEDEETSVDFNEEEVLQRCQDFQKDYEKRKNQTQPTPPVPKPRQFIGGRPISDSSVAKTQHTPRSTVSYIPNFCKYI